MHLKDHLHFFVNDLFNVNIYLISFLFLFRHTYHVKCASLYTKFHLKPSKFHAIYSLRVILIRRSWILTQYLHHDFSLFFRNLFHTLIRYMHLQMIGLFFMRKSTTCLRVCIHIRQIRLDIVNWCLVHHIYS